MTLDAEVEKKVLAALTKNDHGVYLALSPDIMQQIIAQLGELRKKFNDLSQTPIVLTSQIIRVFPDDLRRFQWEFFFQSVYHLYLRIIPH